MKNRSKLELVIKLFLKTNGLNNSISEVIMALNQHPNPNSLVTIRDIFNENHIENITLQFTENEQDKLLELPTPFISYTIDNDFIIVKKITADFVEYYSAMMGDITEDWSIFKRQCTGVVLLAFPEPYKITKNTLNIAQFTQILLILTILLFFTFYSFTLYEISTSWLVSALFLTKSFGLALSVLLLQNQYNKDNTIVNRLCSVEKNDCNKILKSEDSKFLNFLSWSELGFLYFSGGILSLILSSAYNLDNTIMALTLINIPTLLFSFYSVWFQYFKAKSWCRFCLITLGLFWIEALIFWSAPSVFSIGNIVQEMFLVTLGFGVPFTALLLLKPLLKKVEELKKVKKELNEIKFTDDIIDTLFKKNDLKTETTSCAIKINGDTESANIMTIITNPTCPPCAKLHKKLEKYLNGCYEDLDINIIFAVDPEKDKDAERYKVAQRITQIHKTRGTKEALEAMNSWYNDKVFEKWNTSFPADDIEVDSILKEQNEWCKTNNIHYTPSIIFNNRELPKQYSIQDIKYLMT